MTRYIVIEDTPGCGKCGSDGIWMVCDTKEDICVGTSYLDKDDADDLAELLNQAFNDGIQEARGEP